MPEPEQKIIRHWLDAGANHAGTYAVNSHGTIGYYEHSVNVRNDKDWPETQALVEVMNRRCDRCHAPTEAEKQIGTYKLPAHFYARYYPPEEFQKNRYVAHTMSEDGGRFNRHLIYNLSYPELSKAAPRRWPNKPVDWASVRPSPANRFSRTRPTRTIWPSSLPSPAAGSIFWKRTIVSA